MTGDIYAADYAPPTPAMLSTAVGDMETAYTTANGLTIPTPVDGLGSGDIGGYVLTSLPAGNIYKWSTGVTIPTALTIDCSTDPGAVFVFQIAQDLTVSASVNLIQCLPQNIFWVVAGITTLESGISFQGIILDQTQIVFDSGATLVGEALAQSQVTLIGNIIMAPPATAPYDATFDESGIPASGVVWGVTIDGMDHNGTGASLTASGLEGTLAFTYDAPVSGATGVQYVCSTGCSGSVSGAATESAAYTTQYQVSFAVSPLGSGTTSPSTTTYYDAGTGLSISATSGSGYVFSSWSNGDASIVFASVISGSTTATINGLGAITAEFSGVAVPYTVTFEQSGIPASGVVWGVTVGETDHTGIGSSITVTGISGIQPFSFDSPVAGVTGIRYVSTCSGSLTGAGTQSCVYTTQYQISFAVNQSGGGTISPGTTAYYDAGTALPISATSGSGYVFSSWSSGGASTVFTSDISSSTTATINGPGTITAEFSAVTGPSPPPACPSGPVYDYFVGTTLVGTGTHAIYPGPRIQIVAGGPIIGGSNVTAVLDSSLSCSE